MFVKYATGTAGTLSTNALKALTNDAKKDSVVKQFIDAGVPRLVKIVKDSKDAAPVMRFLVNFLSSEEIVLAFLDAEGIEPVLSFVFHAKDPESQKLGVSVLNNLTLVLPDKELDRLAHSKEWKILGNLLAADDDTVVSLTVSVCSALCKSSKNKDYFLEYAVQSFTKLVHRAQLLRSNDKLCASVLKFVARVCEDGKRVSPLVRAEGVYQLVSRSLVSTVGDVSAAALAALANMAAHEKAMLPLQKPITQSATLPQLIKFMSSEHDILRLRAVWSLANLLIHPAIQVAAAELDVVSILIATATNPKERIDVRVKSYTGLFHLSMRLDKMRSELIVGGAFKQLPSLTKLDPEIIPILLKALVNCSLVDDAASLLSQKKVLPEIVKLLSDEDTIKSFSLLILENLCFSSSSSDLVHQAGALPALISVATSSSGEAEAKSLQILANLAFSSKARKDFAASPDMATKLKTLLLNTKKPQATRDGAALALHNLSIPIAAEPSPSASLDTDDDLAEFMNLEFEDDGDLIEAAPVVMPSKIQVSPHRRSSSRNSTSSKSPSHDRDRSNSSSSSRSLNRAEALKPEVPKSQSKPSLEKAEHGRSSSASSDSPGRTSSRRGSKSLTVDGESSKPLSREETVIQDMALKKDQYTINDAPGTPTKSKKKLSLAALLSRIKKKDSNNKLGDVVISRSSSPAMNPTPAPAQQPQLPADPAKLERAKQLFKRTRVAQELLQTEGAYVRDLAILIRKWMNPLFGLPKSVISPEDVRKIFSSVETIFSVNTLLLDGLNEKMMAWSSKQCVGDIFLLHSNSLKAYTSYINNYEVSMATLQKCRQSRRFSKFLEQTKQDPICRSMELEYFLIMPVQRPPRYLLLLKELLSATPAGHPDHPLLQECISKMEEINHFLNSQKKEFELRSKMTELVARLGPEIDAPDRFCVLETEALISLPTGDQVSGSVLIFNDLLAWTKRIKKKDTLLGRAPLGGLSRSLSVAEDSESSAVSLRVQKDTYLFLFNSDIEREMFVKKYGEARRSTSRHS
eukprot:TRINITY_DN2242_c0_g2_i1.p1 TRINITY_DN2242_c0_g2~~TRINITY_DN2242_c0_g2_i1.p1  ORF type:complete len:1030 (-),score=151.22 TRINITY_DN2242_c0_g2_i1:1444-4533(-)